MDRRMALPGLVQPSKSTQKIFDDRLEANFWNSNRIFTHFKAALTAAIAPVVAPSKRPAYSTPD